MKPEIVKEVQRIADEAAPAMLVGADATIIVIACDADGWIYSLRGSRPHALQALEAALEDARRGDGFAPLDPAVA